MFALQSLRLKRRKLEIHQCCLWVSDCLRVTSMFGLCVLELREYCKYIREYGLDLNIIGKMLAPFVSLK